MLGRRDFLKACVWCASAAPAYAQDVAQIPPSGGDLSLLAAPRLSIRPLADDVWLHTSWKMLNGAPISSNGVFVKGERSAVLVDTAWAEVDTPVLLERVAALAPDTPIRLVVTHAHDDRMSGVEIARERGIASLAFHLTQEDAPRHNLPLADETWRGRMRRLDLGGRSVELFYPGPAHTRDNIVAFVPEAGVLAGGCLLRPMAMGLGNTADGDLGAYAQSVRTVTARYGARTRIAVPGHGETGGPELLAHTQALADAAKPA